jgi:hypothetical protein
MGKSQEENVEEPYTTDEESYGTITSIICPVEDEAYLHD